MKKVIIAGALMIATIVSTCVAQEEAAGSPLSFDVSLDLYSAYVWRGQVYNDRPVYQPGASVGLDLGDFGSISAGAWANFDFGGRANHSHFGGINEVDYTLSYAKDIGDVSLEVGHVWYTFPQVNGPAYFASTREVYGSIAYNNDIVVPSLTVYYDYTSSDVNVVKDQCVYGTAALSKDFEITEQLSAGVFVSLSAGDEAYSSYYFGVPSAGLMDANAGASVSYAVTDNISVGATIVWTSLVDKDVRDAKMYFDEDILWGGLNLSASL